MHIFVKTFSIVTVAAFLLSGCVQKKTTQSYDMEINQWHQQREQRLTKPDSWLSLAGLFWLQEGDNTFGSDKSNAIVFPEKAPAFAGTFYVRNGKVKVILKAEALVTIDGERELEKTFDGSAEGKTGIMKSGSLTWYVIKRGDRFLIRLKDSANPAIKNFTGIKRYPVDKRWRIKARLEAYDPPKKLKIANVLGQIYFQDCPGALVFEIGGKEYRLDPEGKVGNKSWFLNFSDETGGRETYGAGRYLELDAADSNGFTYIDFNKAYNPPCAFSPFATCPLPPEGNHLGIRVTAGEKNYGKH